MDTQPAEPPDSAPDAGNAGAPETGPDANPRDEAEDGPAPGRDPLRFNNWRRRSTAGVLMSGIAAGMQKALELEKQQPGFVIEASDEPDPDGPIQLKFDPDDPTATVAIIRRPAAGED